MAVMAYKIGIYRLHDKSQYNLDHLTIEEGKLFFWIMQEYKTAGSWKEFQERTAKPVKEMAMKVQEVKRKVGDQKFKWEDYLLYKIRFDLLGNVGIRTGELKGELSDMIIEEKKE